MANYIAFLRGVSPQTLPMTTLAAGLEAAGFCEVKTILSSGNAVFSSRRESVASIERKIEQSLLKQAGRGFHTIVRTRDELEHLVQADPFGGYRVEAGRKRVVSFSRNALLVPSKLPVERGSARIHGVHGREAYTSYVSGAEGPVFMELIADTFGLEVTTRTWDTILKCLKASV